MTSPSPYSQPYAIAVLIRAVLYGIYVATFIHCYRLLSYRDCGQKQRKGLDKRLLSITLFIFAFLTMSVGVTFQILLYLLQGDSRSAILSIIKIGIENIVVLVTNAVLIYRCWLIYAKSRAWIIISLPLFLWVSALICSILIGYWYTHDYLTVLSTSPTSPDALLVFSRQVPKSIPYWVLFYVFNILINIYVTYGIIHRIRRISRSFISGSRKLFTTCKILARFGCLYIFTTFLSLISVIVDRDNGRDPANSDTMRFALDSINLMVPGITFNIIQIFVHRERVKVASVQRRPNLQSMPPSILPHDEPESGSGNIHCARDSVMLDLRPGM